MASLRDQLTGAWELISYQAPLASNPQDILYPMGEKALGIIMYTPNGYMSAQLQTPGVKGFEYPGTDQDWADVGRKYVAYTGRWFLDEKGDAEGPLLVHEMRNSNLPRLLGDRQRRLCEIKEEEGGERFLYLSVSKPMQMGQEWRTALVRWRRLPDNYDTREPDRK